MLHQHIDFTQYIDLQDLAICSSPVDDSSSSSIPAVIGTITEALNSILKYWEYNRLL